MIEPHESLEESWFGLRVDMTPGVRERSEPLILAGQPCHALRREDLLLHLCLHFCFHLIQGAPSMVQLTDLLVVTRSGDIDWVDFVKRAREARAAPYALAGLCLAVSLLGAPVPTGALDALRRSTPPALRRRVESLGLADILRRTQQPPLVSLGQRVRRGLADRAETARWAPDWRGRWQVWRTLFKPGTTDTGQLLRGRILRQDQ